MGKVVFQCEDSTDGIFTGIYDAWDSRVGHRNVKLEAGREYDMELFSEYRRVETDGVKAGKVAATIRRKLKADVYEQIYNATLSREKDKAEHIYRTVVMGLYMLTGHLAGLVSFGIPYLMPFVGSDLTGYHDERDALVRAPFRMMKRRPIFSRRDQRVRMKKEES